MLPCLAGSQVATGAGGIGAGPTGTPLAVSLTGGDRNEVAAPPAFRSGQPPCGDA